MGDIDGTFQLVRRQPSEEGTTPLQGQAHEIIASILDDPSTELAGVKRRLHRCLAAHPGSPELALLAHLMATSGTVNGESGERSA